MDNSQRQRDLELNQLHGEAETVQPQSRRGSHIGMEHTLQHRDHTLEGDSSEELTSFCPIFPYMS